MKLNKIMILGVFLAFGKISAQFNTIIYTAPNDFQKKEIINLPKTEKNEEKLEKRKKKGIFNITTKKELRKEIDSLKMLLKTEPTKKENPMSETKKMVEEAVKEVLFKDFTTHSGTQSVKKFKYITEKSKVAVPKIAMPVGGELVVTSPFGMRSHPIFLGQKMHNGVDFKAHYENVFSVLDGVISEVGFDNKGGGLFIKVKHSDRFETAYLHLSEMYYRLGESVKAGFIIGKSGNTGNSTGPHLHFAVKEWGKPINPINFLNDLIFANNITIQ